jgi:hypothetical protein
MKKRLFYDPKTEKVRELPAQSILDKIQAHTENYLKKYEINPNSMDSWLVLDDFLPPKKSKRKAKS